MTYDVLFVPRRPGQDWDEALDAAEARDAVEEPLDADRLAQWDRVLRALRARAGEVTVSVRDDAREARHASGLQVCLFPHEASVSFPVREHADAAAFHDLVVDVVGIVERETSLQAYDAQSGVGFDGDLHLGGLEPDEAPTEEADAAAGTPATADEPADAPAEEVPAPAGAVAVDPAAQVAAARRTAVRYTGLGLVILALGLLLRSTGNTGVLVDVTLLLGAFDLAIGAVAWVSYRRRRDALARSEVEAAHDTPEDPAGPDGRALP